MKQALQVNEVIVHENSLVHLKLIAKWKDEYGEHTAVQHIEKFNVWRDIDLLPHSIVKDFLHQGIGKSGIHHFVAGELYKPWQSNLVKTLPLKNFTGRIRSGEKIKPAVGRYYPKGWFSGVEGVFSENMIPVRVVDVDDENITVDYNHPMSRYDVDMQIEIVEIFPPTDEHGGRCSDAIETLLANGPGMQLPDKKHHTDYFVESAFTRMDEKKDADFYQPVRKVHHLDSFARDTVSQLYGRLIKPGDRVLDLMASWESHIPATLSDIEICGIGMNADELQSNPAMKESLVHDLNENPNIPYDDESFDAVICTASIEYLIHPLDVLKEIHRVLKPGGVCVISFSNRWFPTKAISIWTEMHEFERMGLVSEYFRLSDWQNRICTYSSRGLSRPEDDPHYMKIKMSDPVYAVWCHK